MVVLTYLAVSMLHHASALKSRHTPGLRQGYLEKAMAEMPVA